MAGATLADASFAALDALGVETLVLLISADRRPLRGVAGLVDWRLCGELSGALQQGAMKGQVGERLLMSTRARIGASRLLLFGIGPASRPLGAAELGALLESARLAGAREVAVELPETLAPDGALELVRNFKGQRVVVLGPSPAVREKLAKV